jgi:hypothetical protein
VGLRAGLDAVAKRRISSHARNGTPVAQPNIDFMLDQRLQVKAGKVLKIGRLVDLDADGRMTLEWILKTWR